MMQGHTLNAVFNDVVKITASKDKSFETSIAGHHHLTFHHIDIEKDMEFIPLEMNHDGVGTLIVFGRSLCDQFGVDGMQYVRVRFHLDRRTYNLFSSE